MEDDNINITNVAESVRGARHGVEDASEGKARMCSGRTDAYIDGYNAGFLFERIMQTLVE